MFSVARDQFWLRRGIRFWLRRRSFFGEYGVGLGFELFALVIKPGQWNDNATKHKPLGGAEQAIFFSTAFACREGGGAGVAFFAIMIEASPVVPGLGSFFQQPICQQPHAWDFSRAALLQFELSLVVWYRATWRQVLSGSLSRPLIVL